MTDEGAAGPRPPRRLRERSKAEWVTFAIASAMLMVLIGLIASLWLDGPPEPPAFEVQTLPVREVDGRFHLRASVENVGEETAESVQVTAELTAGGEPPEEAEQTIDFLSGGEKEEVEFIFTNDPGTSRLEVLVRSFKAR